MYWLPALLWKAAVLDILPSATFVSLWLRMLWKLSMHWHCIVCESTTHRSSWASTSWQLCPTTHRVGAYTHLHQMLIDSEPGVSTMMISSLSCLSGNYKEFVIHPENLWKSYRTISLWEKCVKTLQNCQHWNFQSKNRIAVLLNLNIFLSPVARCTIFLSVVLNH